MFWIPFFSVTVELGQPVQEPTSFSLTTPFSKPLKMTSPPSSCTVGLVIKSDRINWYRTGQRNREIKTVISAQLSLRTLTSFFVNASEAIRYYMLPCHKYFLKCNCGLLKQLSTVLRNRYLILVSRSSFIIQTISSSSSE